MIKNDLIFLNGFYDFNGSLQDFNKIFDFLKALYDFNKSYKRF